MADVVPTLEDICIHYIVDNFHSLITKCSDCWGLKFIWRFFYAGCIIAAGPAEKILLSLCDRRIIQAEHLNLFSSEYAILRYPVLRNLSITPSSLSILRDLNLYGLEVINLKGIELSQLISLGEYTLENLVVLNLSYGAINESDVFTEIVLGRLENLRSLNVSSTNLTSKCLRNLILAAPRLAFLNISATRVDNINCLLEIKETLRVFVMCDLRLPNIQLLEEALTTIPQLRELRVLDVSGNELYIGRSLPAAAHLCSADCLPYLKHFDIAGNLFGLTLMNVKEIIKNHKTLKFLGLVNWFDPMGSFSISDLANEYPHLTIIGTSGELLLNALTKENVSERNIQKVLRVLKMTVLITQTVLSDDLISALLNSIKVHVYNLISTNLGLDLLHENLSRMTPSETVEDLLTRVVSVVFKCIEEHKHDESTLRQCFSILNLMNIRFEAKFSQKSCIELVFRSLQWHCKEWIIEGGLRIVNIMLKSLREAKKEKFIMNPKHLQLMLTWIAKRSYLRNSLKGMFAEGTDYSTDYLLGINDSLDYPELSFSVIERIIVTLGNLISDCPECCEDFVKFGGVVILTKLVEDLSARKFMKEMSSDYCLRVLFSLSMVKSTQQSLLAKPLFAFFTTMIVHKNYKLRLVTMEIISNLLRIHDDAWNAQIQHSKADFLQTWDDILCNWTPTPVKHGLFERDSFNRLDSLFCGSDRILEVSLWMVLNIYNFLTIDNLYYYDFVIRCPCLYVFLQTIASSGVKAACQLPEFPTELQEKCATLLERRAREIIDMKKSSS